ncbi:hybrid sensor histidine kinase/response regulator transcription factor [Yeosuana sp. AK3]
MRIFKKIFICFIFTLSGFICFSQSQLKIDKINKSNGLSSNRTSSIVKEKGGFVWIGTDYGLNRYDGSQLKVFNKENSTISSNTITDLLIDNKERLWIATLDGGLNFYDQEKNTFKVYKKNSSDKNSLPSNNVRTLFEDSKGNLWVGTEGGLSLYVEKTETFITYRHSIKDSQSISNDIVTSIFEDSKGVLWVGTFGGGLNKFLSEVEKFITVKPTLKIFTDFIHTVNAFDENTLLVGTKGSGLLKLDRKTLQFSDFFMDDFALKNNPTIIRSVFRDSKNNLWVGTDGNGIIKVEFDSKIKPIIKNYVHNAQFDSSLSGNAVYDIMEDNELNIWIGTAWNGVNVLNPNYNYELLFSDIIGKNLTPVLSIYKNEETLFLGLDGEGLTIFNKENQEVKEFNSRLNTSIGGDYIQCIYESSDGVIWIGTFANGLIKFSLKTQTFKQYKHIPGNQKSLSFNDVRSIVEDEFSNLWVATWGGGLNYFNRKTEEFAHYRENKNNPETISSDNILSIKKEGNLLWLATFGGGLCCFNIETLKSINYKHNEANSNSISSDYIFSLLLDYKHNLWIGTSGDGINLFDTSTKLFNKFDDNQDIRYQSITGLVKDNNEDIWFSSKIGVYKFDYNSNNFIGYPKIAGEYNINAVFKDKTGLIYFGTTNGVLRFDPNRISKESIQPEVIITNLKLFNKEVKVGEENILSKNITHTSNITLRYDLNVITFEFAALQFPFSTKCEYAIQMEGFDKDWRTIGQDRTVTYTNLPHGNYTFKVKSKEFGSEWGEKSTSINLEILKPFWLEWWAITIYILFALFTLYLFRRYTIAWEELKANLKLEKLTHEKDIELYNLKQQFFTNISHDIRTPVTLILGSINRLLKINEVIDEEMLNPIETIKKNGNKLVNLVNELLDYRKFESGKIKLYVAKENIVDFCQEVYLSFKELALEREIEFDFKTNTKECKIWFDKAQLEKVLYNLLSNAFKFTQKSKLVEFFVFDMDDFIEIQINDKGVGIAKNQLEKIFNRFYQVEDEKTLNENGYGIGLSISKEIIELHQGEIIVESIKGKGTKFTIKLKKGNAHFIDNQIIKDEFDYDYILNTSNNDFKELINDEVIIDVKKESKKKTILIVEDNSEIRNYISEILKNDFEIMNASHGEEALKIISKNLPDLIVSDVMMPIMDGITLTREIKSNIRTSHIPVILLTARASFTHKIEGFEIGADDYITKPFNETLLKSRIINVLKNRELLHDKFWKKELIPISELSLNKSDTEFMKKLIRILEENMNSSDLDVNFVCDNLGMSHSVMYKKIKSLTNMSYIEFVRDFKLKTAKKLIEEQNFSVLDACFNVGYTDRKYFSKLFKNHFGRVPSDYLNKNK